MKLLLLPLFLLLACVSGSGLKSGAKDELPAACDASGCRIEVECTDRGTCIVTCYDADGSVKCQDEITCDEPCDKACEKPCELPSSCSK
jgi:hypothetical protein